MALNASNIQQIFRAKPTIVSHPDLNLGKSLETVLECPECKILLLTLAAYFHHMKKSHNCIYRQTSEQQLICDYCAAIFPRSKFRHHVRQHIQNSTSRKFQCSSCPKIFKSKRVVNLHYRQRHEAVELSCETCGLLCQTRRAFETHLKSHSRTACPICAKDLMTCHLATHLKIHQVTKSYTCDQCDKRFAQAAGLYQHKQVSHGNHRPQKPVEPQKRTCYDCNKVFSQIGGLYTHRKTAHGPGTSHVCKLCGRSWANKRALEEHKLSHTNIQPHSCSECGASFKWERSYVQHMKKQHKAHVKYKPLSDRLLVEFEI